MCCGTAQNSYQTIDAMKLVLADGTFLDTADASSRAAFRRSHGALLDGLAAIRTEILADPALHARIVEKYRIKNTTGFSLNAFVDFEDPFDVLLHLMIGSEGCLAFMAEITYRTVVEDPHRASALALFANIGDAARAIQLIKGGPVSAAEMMDRASIRSVEAKPGMPPGLADLPDDAAALLIETRAVDPARIGPQIEELQRRLSPVGTLKPVVFTGVKAEYERLWDIRKGLFPAVGAARRVGTTVVIEDVAFPMRHMADATVDLQRLLHAHGYHEGIIFGHALDGNLHFVFCPEFSTPEEIRRYERFMDELGDMVVKKYDGALKAEHGTGRNVAPFVELEWGAKAYGFMRRLKALFDPKGLLNPGVILNDDRRAHLKDLKALPAAHPVIDKCIECGFCEPRCPSRDLTTTPRQRIVIRREIARLDASGADPDRRRRLEDDYAYWGDATCATDGLCATACPVGIDTGEHTKWLRAQRVDDSPAAARAADRFGFAAAGARAALRAADAGHAILGTRLMSGLGRALHAAGAPQWNPAMPRAVRPRFRGTSTGSANVAVYFPSCIARNMGPARGESEETAVYRAMLSLLGKAGFDVRFPVGLDDLCCGMAFDSKGHQTQGARKLHELEEALLDASAGGRFPIVFDTSPCTYRVRKKGDARLRIHDPVPFIQQELLPRLAIERIRGPVAVHVPCSAIKEGLTETFRQVASACADQVVMPTTIGCCGFAGDRGFTYPELNASALAGLRAALPDACHEGYSSSRTCEIGLSLHGGIPYRSLAVLVDRCAQAQPRRGAHRAGATPVVERKPEVSR
jgi:D-lactate dehydrogenase